MRHWRLCMICLRSYALLDTAGMAGRDGGLLAIGVLAIGVGDCWPLGEAPEPGESCLAQEAQPEL